MARTGLIAATMCMMGSGRDGGGGGTPACPVWGWGGDPLRKKRRRGGRGITPLPPSAGKLLFLHSIDWCFSWNHRRAGWFLVVFRQCGGRARPGPEGEGGTPLAGPAYGWGVTPSGKKEGGGVGGSPPSPQVPENSFSCIAQIGISHGTMSVR